MYELIRRWALNLLKVPPEPHPPVGDPASLRVFNAGRNYFRLRLCGWTVGQVFALAGFIFWTALLLQIEQMAQSQKERRENRAAVESTATEGAAPAKTAKQRSHDNWTRAVKNVQRAASEPAAPVADGHGRKNRKQFHGWAGFKQALVEFALVLPGWSFLLIWAVKIFSFAVYLVQIPVTYAIRRLDYEMRWYMVTDRSLRLRQGVWRVSEATMSFANIQEVSVSQGPLQRLLGLADVKVKSAGGGNVGHYEHGGDDMHTGQFHCVTNAPEIRDLILERLRRFREAGLGDPDEQPPFRSANAGAPAGISNDALMAAQELAAEAHALRAVLA
jgi:hypothetical protein